MNSKFLIILIIPLLLFSCSHTPEMVDKTDMAKPMKQFSANGSASLAKYWWKAFSDNKLNGFVSQGLKNNLDLTIAWDRVEQAQLVAQKAGASLYPTVTHTKGYGLTAPSQAPGSDSDISKSMSLGFTASYEVDLWGRLNAAKKAAGYDFKATELDFQTTALTISSSIASSWYQLVQQRKKLKLLESQLAINKKYLQITKTSYNQGQSSISDIYQQQQQIESKESEITLTKMQIELYENAFALLLGETPEYKFDAKTIKFPDLPALPKTGIPADLMNRRPDIQAAYIAVAAANERVGEAIANRYPKLSISANVSGNGDSFETLFSDWIFNLAANMSAPLFDAGKLKIEVERTQKVVQEKLHTYEKLVLSAYKEVEDALITERKRLEYKQKLENQYELAKKSMEVLRKNYLNGSVQYLNVLSQLQSLQSIEIQIMEVDLALINNRIALYKALAGSLDITK